MNVAQGVGDQLVQTCIDKKELQEYFAMSADVIHFFPVMFGKDAINAKEDLEKLAEVSAGKSFITATDKLEEGYYRIAREF